VADRTPQAAHRRRVLLRTLLGIGVALLLVVGGPFVYARFLAPAPDDPLALTTPPPVATPEVPTGPIDVDGTWRVLEGSEAGYRLGEVLSGQDVTVVGRTEKVTGEATVLDDRLVAATIRVDAAAISTDEAARDAFFRRALNTSEFPEATFVLNDPVDVTPLARTDEVLTATATGTLTFHGVSREVTAELQAQRTATGVEVVGHIPVTLSDFHLTAPDLGWVVVEPAGSVEARLLLGR
jgi:polyisoprenoid-binding protein YceI